VTVFLRNGRWIVAALGAAMFLGASLLRPSAASVQPALIPAPRLLTATPDCGLPISALHPLIVPKGIDPGGLDLLAERLRTLQLPAARFASAVIVHVARIAGPPERYTLDVTPRAISIGAGSAAGEMDALATLAQLIGQGGSRSSVPCVHVQDQPALAWRFLSDDVSRGPLPTMEYFTSRIRRLASYKINGYSIYLENIVARPGHETETRADGITKAQLTQLAQICARYHMALVPEQESFAHLSALLSLPKYGDVRENDSGDLISPAAPQTYAVLRDLFDGEFSGIPGIHLIHIGGDETSELGSGRSAALVKRLGYPRVYAQHVTRVAQIVKALGARPLMWGDSIRRYPQILREIPKTIVIVPFDYDVERSYDSLLVPTQRAGFAQLVAPSTANFDRFFPDLQRATGNIGGFVAAAKRHQLLGMFVTVWIGARDELYDATWYPVAFAAADAWEQTNEAASSFCPRFALLSFGSPHACAAFLDFARLEQDFRVQFRFDTPETLWRSDWRVAHFAQRVRLGPQSSARFAAHVAALRNAVAALPEDRDVHEVNAMRVAALRYSILLALLRGERPSPALVQRAEQMHLAEWTYQGRRLSATDQITQRYEAWLPGDPGSAATAFALPPVTDPSAATESRAIQALLVQHEPGAADPSFLLQDPVAYIASSPGIDPQTAAAVQQRVEAFRRTYSGAEIQIAARYLETEMQRATLPFAMKHEYERLSALTKTSSAATVGLGVTRILSPLQAYEAKISDLQYVYERFGDNQPDVLRALDQQRRFARNMANCFQTFVHEWMSYGGGPQSTKDDQGAHLPRTLRAAFCEP
jgi:hypothetical protein